MRKQVELLAVVALLDDLPAARLVAGQVGTVVELLDEATVLVEFSGDDGVAFAIEPVAKARLLVLHHAPQPA